MTAALGLTFSCAGFQQGESQLPGGRRKKGSKMKGSCSVEQAGPGLQALTGQAAHSSPRQAGRPPNNPWILSPRLSLPPASRTLNGPLWRWPPRLPPPAPRDRPEHRELSGWVGDSTGTETHHHPGCWGQTLQSVPFGRPTSSRLFHGLTRPQVPR